MDDSYRNEPVEEVSFERLHALLNSVAVSTADGRSLEFEQGAQLMRMMLEGTHAVGHQIICIGNGGSAAIAAHMAADFSKNGLRAVCFSNLSALTAIANDDGFEHVFEQQVDLHARAGDVLVAISSSGESRNVLRAVQAARRKGVRIVAFSGMFAGNALRCAADLSFYLPSNIYGLLEVGHHCLCHFVLMRSMQSRGMSIGRATEAGELQAKPRRLSYPFAEDQTS